MAAAVARDAFAPGRYSNGQSWPTRAWGNARYNFPDRSRLASNLRHCSAREIRAFPPDERPLHARAEIANRYTWRASPARSGALGADRLGGNSGANSISGGAGDDTLTETNIDASNALFGGLGNDMLTSGVKADFLAGGAGNDTFTLGSGADILAFNTGDGADTVNTVTGGSAVLSLGGGIKLSELSLQKSGADLIVNTNAAKTEKLTLKSWYAATPQTGIAKLQLMVDASTDYLATSADSRKNKRIDTLNFQSVVTAFNSSGTATGVAWSLMNASLTAYLAGSNSMALGGELAYQYGHDNTPQLALGTAQTQLSSASFGSLTQSVTVGLTLPTGQMGLSG